jgi:hypothetical protein
MVFRNLCRIVHGPEERRGMRLKRKGQQMRSYQLPLIMLTLVGVSLAGPALCQTAQPAAAPDAPASPAADESFLTGLRRVGVMAGQVVECSADADKQAQISEAMELANKIAINFRLKAAFNYVGAVGYGSGHQFDKAGCSQSIAGWKEIEAKYLNK